MRIGLPDERHGEEIKACVVLARYKYPRLAEFSDVLPTNATGKILKRELRKAGAAARTAAHG
ncbi:hypothetical protein GCM10010271_29430 [Streptomyces kurssanovii]|nr:hypothetical protein GCM10010271_29430 [Streptomyces kurssanovii]